MILQREGPIKYKLKFEVCQQFSKEGKLVGILLIVLGSLMLDGLGEVKSSKIIENVDVIPILIIVLGALIFIVSFMACCGAIKEINCCVLIYAVFMLILLGLQIALVVWVFVRKDQFLKTMDSIVYDAFEDRDDQTDNSMNLIQITFNCCGYTDYKDYNSTGVPPSCCGFSETTASCPSSIYTTKEGCKTAFYNFWDDNLKYVRFGGIVVIVIEFLALVSACSVAVYIRKSLNSNRPNGA
ncbi:PREDICTED: 23 kDa integral membrane protein-like isoform X1 [Rhagoletis zephyria]|uniref:23 kDa integral membrane protein-like isoform X1 n=1 Tax=Rhagoletis zephyria TaxID=28612 RepID=UPI000811241F|nr:PREDICTED: 23 kDa integral membrane protein-like isoform X1 [Rhagoletis zephyria]